MKLHICSLCWLFVVSPLAIAQTEPSFAPAAIEFFERRVRPVLAEHCFSCHGPEKQRGGVRLDGRAHLVRPRDAGPLVVPGLPDKSALIRALRHEGEIKMPPKGKLAPGQIDDIATWIRQGAAWPADNNEPSTPADWRDHWAFRPVRMPKVPHVPTAGPTPQPIDAFIAVKLAEKGIAPAPRADARTLLRRLYVDLVGLPPTFEEVEDFVRAYGGGRSQAAVAAVVDRLLSSPHFGERWARHWLDVARYADSKGYVFQEERRYPYAYTYRDYVIDAFNRDLPFDRFILEQLAADRLVAAHQAEPKVQAALGFLTLGRRFLNNIHDIIDDRIDVVSRGLMGLTVTCARCHDHKYDPVPMKDYYSLYGVFASSIEPKELPLLQTPAATEETVRFQKQLAELKAAVAKFEEDHKKELAANNRKFRDQLVALQRKVDAFQATAPGAPPRAMVLVDAPAPIQPRVFLRGNPNMPGPVVPRQFLEALSGSDRKPFREGSGRLELARAIASADNPLTARVFVNRVWLHLFGVGLVSTPSDFGRRSDPPSHPELLDYLAATFMNDGWSVKKLIRSIVLSETYQRDASATSGTALDPENRLYWRGHRRRLDFEALRDALLAVGGNLERALGGPAVDITKSPFSGRRTIYGFIDRQNLPGMFRTFDFPNPDTTSPQRFETTVPQQALFLLNNAFVQEQARRVVQRADPTGRLDTAAKIQELYRLIYARAAEDEEVRLGEAFVQHAVGPAEMTPWERYAQVLLLANEFVFVD
ncbi:MAG: PSD1 and planctomycete cytochrome C domain-containing protein [Gemmataceae bacterium]|nr:PSD1 and planctomycete cytochrome C domain-containing protein [Gemmataceae bacterium]